VVSSGLLLRCFVWFTITWFSLAWYLLFAFGLVIFGTPWLSVPLVAAPIIFPRFTHILFALVYTTNLLGILDTVDIGRLATTATLECANDCVASTSQVASHKGTNGRTLDHTVGVAQVNNCEVLGCDFTHSRGLATQLAGCLGNHTLASCDSSDDGRSDWTWCRSCICFHIIFVFYLFDPALCYQRKFRLSQNVVIVNNTSFFISPTC
jgi:hypothetical protein